MELFPLLLCALCLLSSVTAVKVCSRPPRVQAAVHKPEKLVYEPGETVTYSCTPGYIRQSGTTNKAVCQVSGEWIKSTFKCERRHCPYPDQIQDGEMHFKDFKFESSVVFSCHEGFVLRGANVSICTDSGKWSEQIPTCEPVSCPHAPVLEFGRLLTYHPREANISYYLDFARYECLPKYALFGNETITCTASGNWSQLPECRDVKCQRPTEIKNGFMTFSLYREYHYQEVVTYGCNPTYVLEGPRSSFCDKDGNWTTKPVCRAPCHLTTSKAVVLHNGRKTKVEKISNQLINHADTITYYCKDPDKKCSHLVDTQCLDGNLVVPSCYTNLISCQ